MSVVHTHNRNPNCFWTLGLELVQLNMVISCINVKVIEAKVVVAND